MRGRSAHSLATVGLAVLLGAAACGGGGPSVGVKNPKVRFRETRDDAPSSMAAPSSPNAPDPLPAVLVEADLTRFDGKEVEVRGEYRPVPPPMKGGHATADAPATFAVVALKDGTRVYIEPNDAPSAERSLDERKLFAGQRVVVRGTVHRYMPSKGQGLIAPCVSDVGMITPGTP